MCGRSSLTKTEEDIEKRFCATFYSEDLEKYNPIPNYNIAPTNFVPIITNQDITRIQFAHWGLIPSWSKNMDRSTAMINARKESLWKRKAFKSLVNKQRCIIPVDGYYEWKKIGSKTTIPYRITWQEQRLFSMAGLWDQWLDPNGSIVSSFTILTLAAPDFLKDIHHRIPAILTSENEKNWLSDDLILDDSISIIQPIEEQYIDYYTVSNKVNNVRNNDCSLIKEVIYRDPGEQLSLF